jgi:hypothetical protein
VVGVLVSHLYKPFEKGPEELVLVFTLLMAAIKSKETTFWSSFTSPLNTTCLQVIAQI